MSKYLDEALLRLYSDLDDRFYSYLFFQIDRIHDQKLGSMAVGLRKSRVSLIYDENFNKSIVEKHSIQHLMTILKHEALHLVNKHCYRTQGSLTSKSDRQLDNIAADIAINQYLNHKHITDMGGATLDILRQLLRETKPEILPHMTKEYYYNLLMDERQKRKENGEGEQEFNDEVGQYVIDSHEPHEHEADGLEQAMIEGMVDRAIEKTMENNAGKLPANLEEYIKIKKKPKVSWERELRHFTGQTVKSDRKITRSKRNRRYGIKVAGCKKDYKARLLTVVDTSGSMYCSDRISKVLNELYGIYKSNNNLSLDIVECDAEIKDVFKYDGSEDFNIKGGGGTNMAPALEYALQNRYDGVIVLTDGEFYEDFNDNYPVPSLWVIADSDYKSNIGKTINLKDY
jgi:predicted metal-dependent peptidase